jgi:general secretion pathway protein A
MAYWGLSRDPFCDQSGPFVPLPGHDEAVARLVQTIEAGERLALLSAPAGMGKTRVLVQALAATRDPSRRSAVATRPADGELLFARLAEKLGSRAIAPEGQGAAWRALERAVRVCCIQELQVVLAVDGCRQLISGGGRDHLLRLNHLGGLGEGRVTVLLVDDDQGQEHLALKSWSLAIRLPPLSCSEVDAYLTAKLTAGGCRDTIFTPRATARLQVHTGGNPRGLDRLASLCLMAGASRGLEAVSSEHVESVLSECHIPPELALPA